MTDVLRSRMATLLRKIEHAVGAFSDAHEDGSISFTMNRVGMCPVCRFQSRYTVNFSDEKVGHAPDCELAALLRECGA